MKKLLITLCILLLCLATASIAMADRMYVLPDSDTRQLSRKEVSDWNRESLYYAYWEIYARHGLAFDPGSPLDTYFMAQPWYDAEAYDYSLTDPSQISLSAVERYNLSLISEYYSYKGIVDSGFSIYDNISPQFEVINGFDYIEIGGNKVMPVYSAPSVYAWRGANGLAECSSNGCIYAAGYESGWLLIMYETNGGSVRVGYVDTAKVTSRAPMNRQLFFDYTSAKVTRKCVLTDDPARTNTAITTLQPGATVTYLTRFYSSTVWDYVEVKVSGKTARGFVPAGCLDVPMDEALPTN